MTTSRLPRGPDDVATWASHWAQHWFLDTDGRDRVRIHGIDGGWAFQVEAQDVLRRIASEATAIPVTLDDRSLLGLIKSVGLDRAVRAVALRALGAPDAGPYVPAGPTRVAIITETPTPSMLEPALSVAHALPRDACIPAVLDPRVFRRWRGEGFAPRSLALPLRLERTVRRSARREFRTAWQEIVRDPPKMVFNGADVTQSALAGLGRVLHRSAEWIGAEASAVERFLDTVRPRTVLLATDQHRIGRIASQVARSKGVRSVVLQHGLPQGRVGYLPVVADYVAAWSDGSRAWFLENGTPPEKVIVTGNPRLDGLRARQRADLRRSAGRYELLLALSPTTQSINERALRIALDAAAVLGATLTVKLHPGWRRWSFVGPIVRAHPATRTRITHRDPIYPLLQRADVTLIHGSSVAVDSLAAGTPVVIVGDGVSAAADQLQALDLPTAGDGNTLADLVPELATEAGRQAYFSKRDASVEYVVGPRDNRASLRIAELATADDVPHHDRRRGADPR